ncbi:MAG TPA: carbamoyltransferase HypF [Ignavibacteriaceae bacterium]
MFTRISVVIRGAVQGVGFRPFIFRLASSMNLNGFVLNSPLGVLIEAEGEKSKLDKFVIRIGKEKPVNSIIESMEFSFLDTLGYDKFEIRESKKNGIVTAFMLPDIAVCKECLDEMNDPVDRRYMYPFINCTHCGPRFSIIESLPYDRPNTSMKSFIMCEKCRTEYNDPLNRRFHAEPIACPDCGPHVELTDRNRIILSTKSDALNEAVYSILAGSIVALKGLGGYQLICRADDESVIKKLRERKHRDEKPFALMFPSMDYIKEICLVSEMEERLLSSTESPIVLLRKKSGERFNINIDRTIAPENPCLGIMLPYTPLHHLLMDKLKIPVIATSGNLSEEPICINEEDAYTRLHDIADFFLVHNRPIVRHVDDSIVRVVSGREMMIRRSRGYAPLPVCLNNRNNNKDYKNYLAVGGHLKNNIALSRGNNVFVSQHIGDLSTSEAYKTFKNVINDFMKMYEQKPDLIISDLHPDYISTRYASATGWETLQIQHHQAHIASCYAENKIESKVLGVSWDGTGYGTEGTIWGGEFFLYDGDRFSHFAQLDKFYLPGGEIAVKEPRRSAAGVLHKIYGDDIFKVNKKLLNNFNASEQISLKQMIAKKINCPLTSSVGRLFDAVSSIIGISQRSNYEGQPAMMLEFAADENEFSSYPFNIAAGEKNIINWQPVIISILDDKENGISSSQISAKFHNTLVMIILEVSKLSGLKKIVLGGGCFQNVFLLERTIKKLESSGFAVYRHQRIPTNDGGISFGQIAALVFGLKSSDSLESVENTN